MKPLIRTVSGMLFGAWAVLALAGDLAAQTHPATPWASVQAGVSPATAGTGGWHAKGASRTTAAAQPTQPTPWPAAPQPMSAWPTDGVRVAQQNPAAGRSGPPAPPNGPDTGLDEYPDLSSGAPPAQSAPQPMVQAPADATMMPGTGYPPEAPVASNGYPYEVAPGYPGGSVMAGTSFDGMCDPYGACGPYGDPCGNPCQWAPGAFWGHHPPIGWLRDLSLFAGAHGFKGPVDGGQNGNFGIHEGVNWSSPLGDPWGVGFQIGFQAVHSNFQGYSLRLQDLNPLEMPAGGVETQTIVVPKGDRDQTFFTAGLYRRAPMGGLQWGIAFDMMHDSYYYTADVKQMRAELSAVWPGWREIGFWGAFGVGSERVTETFTYRVVGGGDQSVDMDFTLEPTDQFNFFYRQYFQTGGEGRMWAGFTGNSDFVFGGDVWLPLATHWAIETSANVLIPRETGEARQREQAWSVMTQVVWYPGRTARASRGYPFRPVFGVADNSVFLVDRQAN